MSVVSQVVEPPSAPTPAESAAFSWDSFLSTYLPALVLALGTGIAVPAIPLLARSFGVGFGMASGVITAFLLGGLVGSLPTGWLIDHWGRRKVMLVGPLLTSAVAFLVITAHSFPELLLYRFFDGWAAQMWLMARLAAIADRAHSNQRGRQVTWMYGMDNIGKLAGPVVGAFIATVWGVRSPFAAYGVLALLALIPALRFVEQTPARAKASPARRPGRWVLSYVILPRLPIFGVSFFASVARGPIFADMLHLYAAFTYGLDAAGVGLLAAAANILSLPVNFAAGFMMDKVGRKRTNVPGFIGVSVSMLALGASALLHLGLWWYVGLFLTAVAFQSLTGGSIQTIATDMAPPDARGLFLGVLRFNSQTGTVVGPVLFAFLAEQSGYDWAFVSTAAAALAVTWLLVAYIPETIAKDS